MQAGLRVVWRESNIDWGIMRMGACIQQSTVIVSRFILMVNALSMAFRSGQELPSMMSTFVLTWNIRI